VDAQVITIGNRAKAHCLHMPKIANVIPKTLLDALMDPTQSIDCKFIILKLDSSDYFLSLWTLADI
jgi:hypothetical protein